jgi:hypothetical protein
MSGWVDNARYEMDLMLGLDRPNLHMKGTGILHPPMDAELDALKEEDPNAYANLSEHFDLDALRSSPT